MSAAPNVAVVLLIGILYCGGRLLVDRLASLAYPWCDHPLMCYDYAEELAASVDKSVDPCDNLYEHVCARWPRRYPAFNNSFAFLQVRTLTFLLHQLEHPGFEHESLAVRRIVTGYQACVLAFTEHREDIQVAGYALARFFVDRAVQSRAVLDVTDAWNAVRNATRRNFPTLSWMDQSTAAGAINHVDNLVSIIALPAHLNSSQALDAFYDYLEADQSQLFFHWFIKSQKRRSDKLKRLIREDPNVQVHREDMPLSSYAVNAFYLPLYHIMSILPAIMAPPFVAPGLAPAVNYGAIGKILGHELSHAFDPRFSNQTRTGHFGTWWSQTSYDNFKQRLQCVRNQLANYTGSESHGSNALSETFADTAGTEKARLAYDSLPTQPGMLGYSQEQLFFVAGCFEFCAKDPYSWEASEKYPAHALRCNLPVSNEKKFAAAFKCPTGAVLNPPKRCTFH
ncbi:endothelin-converting enzyme homolog isoform X2 [Dermacentor albipictus]|uniref:endothelin-converting enzyme homolog isoform X2 n=1 Tax=Dermacentor albipictus TaxID=60249 RepID=UPI0038FC3995